MSMDQIDQVFFKKLLHEACDSKNYDKPKNVGTAMAMVYGAKKIKSRYSKIQKFLGIMNCETMALELQFMFYYNLYEYLIKDVPSTDVSYWKQLLTEHKYKDPDQSNDLWTNIFGDNVVNIKRIYMSDDGKIMKQEEKKSAGEDGFDQDFFETFFSEDEDEESNDINTVSNGKNDIVLGNKKEKEANKLGRDTDDTLHERDKISGDSKVENPLNIVQHKSKSQDNSPASGCTYLVSSASGDSQDLPCKQWKDRKLPCKQWMETGRCERGEQCIEAHPVNYDWHVWYCSTCGVSNFISKFTCRGCKAKKDRSGEWPCSSCGFSNFASRFTCLKCSTGKDGTPAEKWNCQFCGFSNFTPGSHCFKCRMKADGTRESGASGDMWTCPSCGFANYSDRQRCFQLKCRTPNPNSDDGTPRSIGDMWTCPTCGFVNDSYRERCFRIKCKTPNPNSDALNEIKDDLGEMPILVSGKSKDEKILSESVKGNSSHEKKLTENNTEIEALEELVKQQQCLRKCSSGEIECIWCHMKLHNLNFVKLHLNGVHHRTVCKKMEATAMKMTLEELVKQEQCFRKVSSDNIKWLYECLWCNIRVDGTCLKEHWAGNKHKKLTSKYNFARSALVAGLLQKEKSGYSCLLCNKNLENEKNVKKHLAGAKHNKAVSKLENETTCLTCNTIISTETDVREHFAEAKHKEAASICLAWNDVGVCQWEQCLQLHRCSKCGGEHPRLKCHTKKIKSCTEISMPEKVPRLTGEHPRLKCPTKNIKSCTEISMPEKVPKLTGMCDYWNDKGVCPHKPCSYKLRCNFCGGEHPRIDCTTENIESENERGLQEKRPILAGKCNAWNKSGHCHHKQCWYLHECNFCGGTHPRFKCPNEIVKTENEKGISSYEMSNMPIPSGTNLSIPPPGCRIPTPSPVSTYIPSPIPHPMPVSSLTILPPSPIQSPYIAYPVIPSAQVSSITIPPPSHIQSSYTPSSVPPPAPISSLTIPPPSHIQSSYTPNPVPPPAPISSLTVPPPSHIQSSYTPNHVPPPAPISSLTFPPPSHIQSSYTPSSAPPPAPVSSIITPSASIVSTSLSHLAPLPRRLRNRTDSYCRTTAPSINLSDLGLSFATKQNHISENLNIKLNNENLAEGIRGDRNPKRSYKFSTNRNPDEKDNSENRNKRYSRSRSCEKLDKEYIKSPVRRHRDSESKSPERKQRKYSRSPDRCYKKFDRNHDRKQQKKLRSKSPDRHDRGSSKNVQINKACKSLMSVCDKIGILGHSLRAALDKTQRYRNDCSKIIETFSDPDGQELLLLIATRLNKLCEETKDNMLRTLFRDAGLATNLLMKTTKSYLDSSNSDTESEQSSESYSFNDRCSSTSTGMNNDIESSTHMDFQKKCSDDLTLEEKELIQRISEGKLNDIRVFEKEYAQWKMNNRTMSF